MKNRIISIGLILCAILITCFIIGCGSEKEPDNQNIVKVLTGIEVTVMPTKTNYFYGEKFDPSGMEVKAVYEDSTKEVVTGYTYDEQVFKRIYSNPSTQREFLINYEEKTTTITLTVTHIGNPAEYSVESTPALSESELEGKNYFFLGSSVTQGSSAHGESMADYIAKRNNCTVTKESISGTTLLNNGDKSYVSRINNFDKTADVDAFICQLSTNDAKDPDTWGQVSESFDINDFDNTTTFGAIEYIIAYAKAAWNCDIVFYTNSYYVDENYEKMVEMLGDIQDKWGIVVLDLYDDEEFNNITSEQRTLYMSDNIHPTRAGYRYWWTPMFEDCLKGL